LFIFLNAKKRVNMPKMKTHSGAKKRFKLTASGKVKASQAGKQHFMRRRTKAQLRNQRGTTILDDEDAKRLVKIFLPNGTN
jgi:large subunit ribosomal protein L35